MIKKLTSIALILVMLFLAITPAYATPPPNPDIESGTAAAGGNYFQYLSSDGWKDLKTPPHWVVQTGEVAYCLDHKADSPNGDEGYTAFNPQAVYSTRTYNGLLAILKNGYPYQKGGLSSTQARYATANAVRAWLSESAGIGYNFMNLSRGYVRPKSGQEATYNFMVSLVNKARNNQQPTFSISTNPSTVTLDVQGNQLVGQTKIVFGNINGYYSIDNSRLPSGVSISGYTGANGDVLTITAPISYAGQTISIDRLFEGHDTRATSNIYWFEPSGNDQPVLVPVIDTTKPVVRGSVSFTSEGFGYIEVVKKDAVTNANLVPSIYSGFLTCADCGKKMVRNTAYYTDKSDGKTAYNRYVCSTYKKLGSKACTSHLIREDVLNDIVLDVLKTMIESLVYVKETMQKIESTRLNKQIALLENDKYKVCEEMNKTSKLHEGLYSDYKDEIISLSEYKDMKISFKNRHDSLVSKKAIISDQILQLKTEGNIQSKDIESYLSYEGILQIDRNILINLVDEIMVDKSRNITINLNAEDELKNIAHFWICNTQRL